MQNVTQILFHSFGRTLYICLRRNQITMRHIESGRETTLNAEVSFSNARLLVAQSTLVTRLMQEGMQSVLPGFGIAPAIVMHPLEMVEDGISEVEETSLTEIGYVLGAREVVVVTGPVLSDEQVAMAAANKYAARKTA
jgi:rod shape-determining protein MreB and related proteins